MIDTSVLVPLRNARAQISQRDENGASANESDIREPADVTKILEGVPGQSRMLRGTDATRTDPKTDKKTKVRRAVQRSRT